MAKRAAAQVEEMEEVEDVEPDSTGGAGVETALVIVTTIALLCGIVVGLLELGKHYATGPFGP